MKIDIVRMVALCLWMWLWNKLPIKPEIITGGNVAVMILLLIALWAGWF